MTVRAADEAAIRERAYFLWEEEGRPSGRDTEHWLRAAEAVATEAPAPAKGATERQDAGTAAEAAAAPRKAGAASKGKAGGKTEPGKKTKKK